MMAAPIPACPNRSRRCLAFDCSLKVAIVTMVWKRPGRVLSKQHSTRLCKTGRRKPLIKHQINEHAGDRDVKPDRHRPFCDPPMFVPAALEDRNEGENDERKRDKGEQNVARQHWKINC